MPASMLVFNDSRTVEVSAEAITVLRELLRLESMTGDQIVLRFYTSRSMVADSAHAIVTRTEDGAASTYEFEVSVTGALDAIEKLSEFSCKDTDRTPST